MVNLLDGWIAGFDNLKPPRPGGRFSPPASLHRGATDECGL